MTSAAATECSPLLIPEAKDEVTRPPTPTKKNEQGSSFPLLFEIIGARNLPVDHMESYCVVQYGPRTIHRTKPFSPPQQTSRISRALGLFGGPSPHAADPFRHPIWTMHEDCILTFVIQPNDIDNNKALKITIWARPQARRLRSAAEPMSVGTIRIKAPNLLQDCLSEQRIELPLMTDLLDTPVYDERGEPSTLAYRCRIATDADLKFYETWMKVPRSNHWAAADVVPEPGRPRARLLTEMPEQLIQPTTATTITGKPSVPPAPPGYVHVKPYPDPMARPDNRQYMRVEDLKKQTIMPSRKWIEAGSRSSSIGRLYLEVLSAHGLPNVDIGEHIGNVTDAFCSIVYGDAMAQTDVIFDELNPHWLPWTQRAFVFYMQHPSQVLYLGVFGFKGIIPLQHRPIGRIEVNPINLHNDTIYNLEYDLFESSHGTERQSRGRLRIRVRIEIDDERKALLAALIPPAPVYINTARKKSMSVARYTACGEYDNQARFSLQVLQGYIDEILAGYVRRMLYSIQDGFKSLVLWRNQVTLFGIGLPLFSLLAFVIGILIVERPQLIPAMISFILALFLLEQMNQRVSSPSPWRRSLSFSYYLRVLILGHSGKRQQTNIAAFEGAKEFEERQTALRARIAADKEFIERKEAFEKQIEAIESFKLQDNSQPIPMELLLVLGKVQGIVGDFCRLCRLVDAIITWEESDVAFWMTLGFLVIGTVFIFIPWGWLLLWLGRASVVLFLGPQNKVLDLLYYQNTPTKDQRIYRIFASRMFDARCRQENAGKLRAFRQLLFGKCATLIPPLYWSPHQDFPLASSTSHQSDANFHPSIDRLPVIPGQSVYGDMIPRPREQWEKNRKESEEGRAAVTRVLKAKRVAATKTEGTRGRNNQPYLSPTQVHPFQDYLGRPSSVLDEGLEITDVFDEEAGFIQSIPSYLSTESNGNATHHTSVHDFGDETASRSSNEEHVDDDNDDDDDDSVLLAAATGLPPNPTRELDGYQRMVNLGFEAAATAKLEHAVTSLQAFSGSLKKAAVTGVKQFGMRHKEARGGVSSSSGGPSQTFEVHMEGIPRALTIMTADHDDTTDGDDDEGFEVIP